MAFIWTALALTLACTLAGFPPALKCLRFAYISYKPFGKSVTLIYGKNAFLGLVWTCTLGGVMAVFCLISAITSCAVIAGIPSAGQWVKLIKRALFPYAAITD